MELVDSLKCDGKMASYAGYLYRKDKQHQSTTNWRCAVRGCKGRLITANNAPDNSEPTVRGEHSHVPDPARIEVKKLQGNVTQKAILTQEPPRRIIKDEISASQISSEAAVQLRANKNLSVMINRKRKRVQQAPAAPTSRSGFEIPERYTQTPAGNQFLLFDSGVDDFDRILIFGTTEMVQLLNRYTHWFCDGTFSVSPKVFYQLYTVHAMVNETIIPCIYAFLPNKTRETYQRFWAGVASLETLEPESIMTDYELAAVQALQAIFPNTTVAGCFFHIGQAVWRHIQHEGLCGRYTADDEFRAQVKSLLALAFLPVELVAPSFDDLIETYPPELYNLSTYFEETYIGRKMRNGRRQPRFPISMWNMSDRLQNGLPRTNNSVESWHSSFQGSLQCSHPSIWKLLADIISEHTFQQTVLAQAIAGTRPLKNKPVYKRINNSLKDLFARRENMPLLDFLRGCSYHLSLQV